MTRNELEALLEKTDGRCHLCGEGRLTVSRYGDCNHPQGWERDHSNPRARGGTDRASNLLPAHISCNRAKQDMSTRAFRKRNGFTKRPMSRAEQEDARAKNTVVGALSGAAVGAVLLGGPGAWLVGGLGLLFGLGMDVE